jgi:hypothetical protein
MSDMRNLELSCLHADVVSEAVVRMPSCRHTQIKVLRLLHGTSSYIDEVFSALHDFYRCHL